VSTVVATMKYGQSLETWRLGLRVNLFKKFYIIFPKTIENYFFPQHVVYVGIDYSQKLTNSMKKIIISGLCLWTAACLFVHGPIILVYICFQALTSGVFALEMRRIEKRNLKKTQDRP